MIEDFKNHSSCEIIKQYFKNQITFTLRHVTTQKVIHDLKNNNAAGGEIPVKIFKKL